MRDSRRSRLILTLLLLVALTFVALDLRSGESSPLTALRGFGAAVFGPIEQAAASVVDPVQSTVRSVVHASGAQRRVASLQRENARLRARLQSSRLARERAGELEELRDLAGRGRYRTVPAEVVAVRGARGFEYTTTIDVGARDGIERNMTVVCAEGLVGRVVHVGTATSTVLLAIDGSSQVGARLEASDEIGIVRGRGNGGLQLTLLDVRAGVQQGDRLVTFGSQGGSPYVAGVPIGTVTSVRQRPGAVTSSASVRPFVDYSTLDLVGVVVQPPRQNPRDSVLPPEPAPESTELTRSAPRPTSAGRATSAAEAPGRPVGSREAT